MTATKMTKPSKTAKPVNKKAVAAKKQAAPAKTAPARKSAPQDGNGRSSSGRSGRRRWRNDSTSSGARSSTSTSHDLGVGLDAFRDGDDEIDRANFDSDRDLALSLSDTERETLLQIEEALRRIDTGAFGSCTSCSKPIGDLRLNAIPWARYCIDCQELEEKGLLG